MTITIFGASGKIGRLLIKKAIEDGYKVKAVVRNPHKLDGVKYANLKLCICSLSNIAAIDAAIAGSKAVISVIGPIGEVTDSVLQKGMRNIVDSMKRQNITRLIAISTGNIADKADKADVNYKLRVSRLKLKSPANYKEIVELDKIVRNSPLDWTLVRVGNLNDDPAQPVNAHFLGYSVVKPNISRASVANFMIAQINSIQYIRQSPAISN